MVGQTSAPAHWRAELANVVWMAVRTRVLPVDKAHRRLDFASRLRVRSVSIRRLWQAALRRALESDLPVYDTLFVELAERMRMPLVTFDVNVLKTFPSVACRPGGLLSKQR